MLLKKKKKLNLSDVMVAMDPWAYFDLETGKAAQLSGHIFGGGYPYVPIEGKVDTSRFIRLPAVLGKAFSVEFVKMQNFPAETLRKFGIPLELDMPVILERDKDGKIIMPPNYDEYLGIYGLLGTVIMETEEWAYSNARLAGLARKWCQENGYEVEEDYLTYYENY